MLHNRVNSRRVERYKVNLTSINRDPIHASLALSSLLSVWYKPYSLNNKSIYNTLLLEFYTCAKPRLTHWYPCPKKKCHYFCTGVYHLGTGRPLVKWLKISSGGFHPKQLTSHIATVSSRWKFLANSKFEIHSSGTQLRNAPDFPSQVKCNQILFCRILISDQITTNLAHVTTAYL